MAPQKGELVAVAHDQRAIEFAQTLRERCGISLEATTIEEMSLTLEQVSHAIVIPAEARELFQQYGMRTVKIPSVMHASARDLPGFPKERRSPKEVEREIRLLAGRFGIKAAALSTADVLNVLRRLSTQLQGISEFIREYEAIFPPPVAAEDSDVQKPPAAPELTERLHTPDSERAIATEPLSEITRNFRFGVKRVEWGLHCGGALNISSRPMTMEHYGFALLGRGYGLKLVPPREGDRVFLLHDPLSGVTGVGRLPAVIDEERARAQIFFSLVALRRRCRISQPETTRVEEWMIEVRRGMSPYAYECRRLASDLESLSIPLQRVCGKSIRFGTASGDQDEKLREAFAAVGMSNLMTTGIPMEAVGDHALAFDPKAGALCAGEEVIMSLAGTSSVAQSLVPTSGAIIMAPRLL